MVRLASLLLAQLFTGWSVSPLAIGAVLQVPQPLAIGAVLQVPQPLAIGAVLQVPQPLAPRFFVLPAFAILGWVLACIPGAQRTPGPTMTLLGTAGSCALCMAAQAYGVARYGPPDTRAAAIVLAAAGVGTAALRVFVMRRLAKRRRQPPR